MQQSTNCSRRHVLAQLAAAGLTVAVDSWALKGPVALLPNQVGYATIAWPNEQFEHALSEISKLRFKGVEMVSWIRQKYSGTGLLSFRDRLIALSLKPVSLYCFPVDPLSTAAAEETKALNDLAVFLKDLGGSYLEVTDGLGPQQASDHATVKALAERLSLLGKVGQDHGLGFGYHPHVGSLGQSRQGFGRVLEASDPRYVRLIADVAHLTLGGSDPAEVIRTYRNRLLYLHFKDARRDAARLASQDPALLEKTKYWFCEIGTGVVNFPSVMRAVRDSRFTGWIVVGLDGYEPPPGGPDQAAETNKQAVERLGLRA